MYAIDFYIMIQMYLDKNFLAKTCSDYIIARKLHPNITHQMGLN